MHKFRFTKHQIIAVLKSAEAGQTVKNVCQLLFQEPAITARKRNMAGWDQIKVLEDENRQLKQMFANLSLEYQALTILLRKNFKTSDKT